MQQALDVRSAKPEIWNSSVAQRDKIPSSIIHVAGYHRSLFLQSKIKCSRSADLIVAPTDINTSPRLFGLERGWSRGRLSGIVKNWNLRWRASMSVERSQQLGHARGSWWCLLLLEAWQAWVGLENRPKMGLGCAEEEKAQWALGMGLSPKNNKNKDTIKI